MFKLPFRTGVESIASNDHAGGRHRRALVRGLAVAVGIALSVSACSAANSGVKPKPSDSAPTLFNQKIHDSLPESIKTAGKLTVAVTPTYPPYEYLDTDGQTVIGQNADAVEKLGEVLGLKIEWAKVNEFGSILSGIAAHRFDTAVIFSDTLEREKAVDIVSFYADGSAFNGPVTLPHEDTVACGRKVGLGQGSTPDQFKDQLNKTICTDAGLPPIEWFPFANTDLAFVAMNSGQIDLTIVSTATGAALAKSSNGKIGVLTKAFLPTPTGMPFAKDNRALTEAVAAAFQVLIDDGTIRDILKKWDTEIAFVDKVGINVVGSGS